MGNVIGNQIKKKIMEPGSNSSDPDCQSRNLDSQTKDALKSLIGTIIESNESAEIYKYYHTLNTKIELMKSSNQALDRSLISLYIKNSHGPTHKQKVTPIEIYAASRRGEHKMMKERDLGNRRMLWYGIRKSKLQKVLRNGIPTDSNGAHFNDCVTRAAASCHPEEFGDDSVILILAEVALGNIRHAKSGERNVKLAYGEDSFQTSGLYKPARVEPMPRTSHGIFTPAGQMEKRPDFYVCEVNYNDFCIYDKTQFCIRYLVHCRYDSPHGTSKRPRSKRSSSRDTKDGSSSSSSNRDGKKKKKFVIKRNEVLLVGGIGLGVIFVIALIFKIFWAILSFIF